MGLTRLAVGRTVTILLAGNVLMLVAIPVLLGVSFANPTWIVIENLAMLIPTLACFGYAFFPGERRAAALLLGFAMLSQAAGNVIYSEWTQYQAHPPVPSPADIAYLGFYVSVAAAVVWLARRDAESFPKAMWLDGAIGAAGAAVRPGPGGKARIPASAATGCRAHIVHLSSAAGASLVRQAKADGVRITAETCPHYLTLAAETIPDGSPQYKCCPPIRGAADQDALWAALADGNVDLVVSDHSPCTASLKSSPDFGVDNQTPAVPVYVSPAAGAWATTVPVG